MIRLALAILATALAARSTAAEETAPAEAASLPLVLRWEGQSAEDRTGRANLPLPSGVNDFLISLDAASMTGSQPVQWTMSAAAAVTGYLDWEFPPTAKGVSQMAIERSGGEFNIFFEPFLSVPTDVLTLVLTYADGTQQSGRVASGGVRWGAFAKWEGQTDEDLVGEAFEPDGRDDWMIEVRDPGLNADKVAAWTVWQDYFGREETLHDVWFHSANPLLAPPGGARPLAVENEGRAACLFFNPTMAREGDEFTIQAVMEDGSILAWTLSGGGTDWGETAIYRGRVPSDSIGEEEGKPNGVNDIEMEIHDPLLNARGLAEAVVGTRGGRWSFPMKEGDRFLKTAPVPGGLRLTLDNPDDLAGRVYFVSAALKDGKVLGWAVAASRSNHGVEAAWLGQTEDRTGKGDSTEPDGILDWSIAVEHPLLAVSEVRSWEIKGDGRSWGPPERGESRESLVFEAEGESASERTLFFSEASPFVNHPIRRGAKFTVTAVLADGNVVHWTLASPGSPMMRSVEWAPPTRENYVLKLRHPDAPLASIRASGAAREHVWTVPGRGEIAAADARLDASSKETVLYLDRSKSALTPGEEIRLEAVDALGVRVYGIGFAGSME